VLMSRVPNPKGVNAVKRHRPITCISQLHYSPSALMSPPPWNSWSLDEQFFVSLCRWKLQNDNHTLTQVLDEIRTGIETVEDVTGLIPDSPFPARSMVEALLALMQLGIVCFRAITLR
jgi:hypothetical protein